MKIPRPKRTAAPFRRKTSPPPAARRLLLASMVSGLILIAMLAIVFVPRGLELEGETLPSIVLALNTTAQPRVVVVSVSAVLPLSQYAAEYARNETVLASLFRLEDGAADGSFSFHDMDSDGNLTKDDEFRIVYSGTEVLRLTFLPAGRIVGFWPSR